MESSYEITASSETLVSTPPRRPRVEFRNHSLAKYPLTVISTDYKGAKTWTSKCSSDTNLTKTRSACTLPHDKAHGWLPWTMKYYVLIPLAFVTLAFAGIMEFLAQKSQKEGGLVMAKKSDDIPSKYIFLYNFFPTIIAVTYSMAWSWVDLDVKRLEPWLALSQPDGALAERSLFIQYPLEFMPTAPFKAFRRRQMRVLYSSLIIILVSLVVTPLQSAAIGTETVQILRKSLAATTKEFLPIGSQSPKMDQSVLYTLYTSTWLNQSYPEFTNEEYALVPFSVDVNIDDHDITEANLTSTTTRMWTELTCTPATYEQIYPRPNGMYWFSNGAGCNVTNMTLYPDAGEYKFWAIAYQDSPFASYSLQPYGEPCPPSVGEHLFLIAWAYTSPKPSQESEGTFLFCESQYYAQEVEATVSYPGYSPISYTSIGDVQKLNSSRFNVTAFEYLIGSGALLDDVPRDYLLSQYIEQYPQVASRGVTPPLDTMVGFALGRNKTLPTADYKDRDTLQSAFVGAQKSLFAVAAAHMLAQNATSANSRDATYVYTMEAITVNRAYALAVEIVLCIVALLTAALAYECFDSLSMLSSSPNSITTMMTSFRNKQELIDFSRCGNLSEEDLIKSFKGKRFRFRCGCETDNGQPLLERLYEGDEVPLKQVKPVRGMTTIEPGQGLFNPVRPMAFRRRTGVLFCSILLTSIALLIWLDVLQKTQNGIQKPSHKKEVVLLLFSYIPTAFSTLLEPCWSFINRHLCVLQPYKDLSIGNKPAEKTINARYTSVPSQLVLFRALKAGHILLFLVCIVALLANVLSVSLAGLFSEAPVQRHHPVNFTRTVSSKFNQSSCDRFTDNFYSIVYRDPSYVLLSNISEGTTLPPWATMDYAFQPFDIPDTAADSFSSIVAGYTVDSSCTVFPNNKSTSLNPPSFTFSLPDDEKSNGTACTMAISPNPTIAMDAPEATPSGPAAGEGMPTIPKSAKCGHAFLQGWVRWSNYGAENGTVEYSYMVCRPYIKYADFNITVDSIGHILDYHMVDQEMQALDEAHGKNASISFITQMSNVLSTWSMHTDNVTQNEIGNIYKAYSGNDSLFYPSSPLPSVNDTKATFETVYTAQLTVAMALNPGLFESTEPQVVSGITTTTESRIFISNTALIITLVILAIDIGMVIIVYARGINFYLPRLPSTLGSVLAYVAMNRGLEVPSKAMPLVKQKTFSFGRYVGIDGKTQLGIEEDPYVVKVADAEAKGWISSMSSKIFFKRKPKEQVPAMI